jgi:hypothetical protein
VVSLGRLGWSQVGLGKQNYQRAPATVGRRLWGSFLILRVPPDHNGGSTDHEPRPRYRGSSDRNRPGLLNRLASWGKGQGFPARVVDWNAEETDAALDEWRRQLDDGMVCEARRQRAAGWSLAELTRRYGVSCGAVGYVVRGVTWSHV